MSLSLYDLFVTMGPFAKFIVVVLAVMSVISWANAVQKLVQIIRSERQTQKFAPEFSRFLQEEQLDGAIKLAALQLRRDDQHLALYGPLHRVDVGGGDRGPVAQQRLHFRERLAPDPRHVAALLLPGQPAGA